MYKKKDIFKMLSYRLFRRWVVFKKWTLSKVTPKDKPLSPEQDKAFKIARKLIINSDSILHADLNKERYIIVNGNLFVRITIGKIKIINGNYKYDISFEPSSLHKLTALFSKNLEHRHDRLEHMVSLRVEKSLDHIIDDINNNLI